MEPFRSNIVGSEIVYRCQSGFLPEGRRTLLCGEDGRWDPDPQRLCTGITCFIIPIISPLTSLLISVSDKSLSTAAVTAITAVVCSLATFVAGAVCGVLLTVCISRLNKKRRGSKSAPNTQEQQQAAVVYEEVDTKIKKIELKENVAYGPVKPNQ